MTHNSYRLPATGNNATKGRHRIRSEHLLSSCSPPGTQEPGVGLLLHSAVQYIGKERGGLVMRRNRIPIFRLLLFLALFVLPVLALGGSNSARAAAQLPTASATTNGSTDAN